MNDNVQEEMKTLNNRLASAQKENERLIRHLQRILTATEPQGPYEDKNLTIVKCQREATQALNQSGEATDMKSQCKTCPAAGPNLGSPFIQKGGE